MIRRKESKWSSPKLNRICRGSFYQQVIVMILSTGLAIAVWLIIRHAHLDAFRSAYGWANSYRQIMILAKNGPKIRDIVSGQLRDDQRRTLLNEIKKDHEIFCSYFRETHRIEKSRFPHAVTDQVTQRICDWIKAVNRFLGASNNVGNADLNRLASNVNNVKDRCEEALIVIVQEYTEAMKHVAEMRHDMTSMILLALLALLTIAQLFLLRSEHVKQSASIRLSEELATIIHDVKVPQQVAVNAISMILLPDTGPGTVKEMVQVVADSLSAMQRLLDTALLRINAEINPDPVQLAPLLRDISTVHEAACKEKGLIWKFYLAASAETTIVVDVRALIQILNNLLSNAIRYTDKGAVSLNVSLDEPVVQRYPLLPSRSSRMHTLVITVTDTGCGIPKDFMSLIFKKFQQIRPRTGFGIGLFTVSRLTNNLRGRIDLWSEIGKGTRFAVSIPVSITTDSKPRPP